MLRRKEGTCIYIENSGISLTNQDGHPYGAIGILKDITRTILADQEERVIHAQNKVIYDTENIHIRTRGTLQDITEHKKQKKY